MKELLQKNQCTSWHELYASIRMSYFDGHVINAKRRVHELPDYKRQEFIFSMSPYDPAYAFFSTLEFAETV